MATFAEVLPMLTHGGAQIYRENEPQHHYELDAAEGLTIWKYNGDEDDLSFPIGNSTSISLLQSLVGA